MLFFFVPSHTNIIYIFYIQASTVRACMSANHGHLDFTIAETPKQPDAHIVFADSSRSLLAVRKGKQQHGSGSIDASMDERRRIYAQTHKKAASLPTSTTP